MSNHIDSQLLPSVVYIDTDNGTLEKFPPSSIQLKLTRRLSTRRVREPRRKGGVFPGQLVKKGRLVGKNGTYGLKASNIPNYKEQFIRDIYTTLLDIRWKWTLILVVSTYLISWTLYASIYYACGWVHGDFELVHLANDSWAPCVKNSHSFLSMFLFSVETQGTIGYGFRYVTEECPIVITCASLQLLSGVLIEAFLVAIVITKLAQPGKRAQTLIYSQNAVISQRDGNLCFMFRIGDMRRTHLIDCNIRLMLIKSYETQEKELLPFQQFDMAVGFHKNQEDHIFLAWPTIVCHVIDESSPLFDYSEVEIENGDFEVIAILEGIVESTGNTTQARTSYKPTEILWGHRFEPLLTYQSDNGVFNVNYARFHNTYAVDTPTCSARVLCESKGSDPVSSPEETNDS